MNPVAISKVDKDITVVPVLKNLAELIAVGWIGHAEECLLVIDIGTQVSLLKRGVSSAPLTKPDVHLRGISGAELKVHGRHQDTLLHKHGTTVKRYFIVGNLLKGYLTLIGCDLMKSGRGSLDTDKSELQLFGHKIRLNKLLKG